jgi:hypothetical protein
LPDFRCIRKIAVVILPGIGLLSRKKAASAFTKVCVKERSGNVRMIPTDIDRKFLEGSGRGQPPTRDSKKPSSPKTVLRTLSGPGFARILREMHIFPSGRLPSHSP